MTAKPTEESARSGWIRASFRLAGFLLLTIPLMPVQALALRVSPRLARGLPHWYHRRLCQLLGVRILTSGRVVRALPVLIAANHTSWLDIPVLSAVAPVSFVAKKEVGGWPFVATLARLQRTVFVDRARPSELAGVTSEMAARLKNGDALVLFAEGTSSDGNRVLPFRSPLFAAAFPSAAGKSADPDETVVQPLTIVYTRLHGVPLGRADRARVGWYGDMEMLGHAWALLKAGPLDVRIEVGAPVPLATFAGRKTLARTTEHHVRHGLVRILRARADGDQLTLATHADDAPRKLARGVQNPARKWV